MFRQMMLAALLVVVGVVSPVQADEVIDQINEAIRLYKAGDFAGAISELDFASAQIRQQRAGEMSNVLPKPLAGWKAEEAETTAMGAAMLGGITGASRAYRKDDAHVTVAVVADSPMLSMFAMVVGNPMMMSGSGNQAVRVKGHRGVLEWQGDSGSLNLVVDGAVLVTVEGSGCKKEDLVSYAEGVNYELLKGIVAR